MKNLPCEAMLFKCDVSHCYTGGQYRQQRKRSESPQGRICQPNCLKKLHVESVDVDSVDVSITFAQIGMLQIQSTALLPPASLSTSQPKQGIFLNHSSHQLKPDQHKKSKDKGKGIKCHFCIPFFISKYLCHFCILLFS